MNSGQPATWLIMVAILLVIGVVWMLFCRRTRKLALGLLGIAALGMLFLRVSHRPSPVWVHDDGTAHMDQLFDVHQQHAVIVQAEQAEILKNLPVQREPIESLWTKLTAPKINLEAPAQLDEKATQRELANAAKVILSASAPGADPFTQGWLINAAKAIMSATPKGGAPSVEAEMAHMSAPQVTPAAPVTPLKVVTVSKSAVKAEKTPDEPRPDWVDAAPKLLGNTQRMVVSTDPFVTVEECHAALRDKLRGVVQGRVIELARAANGGHYASAPGLDSMGITIEYILSELCPDPDKYYIETLNTSVGEMKRAYALVEFNDTQDRILLDRWRASARVQSIRNVGTASALVVAILGFVYGLLKVDTWTRGYYTKRLFLGVPAAIIAFVALVGMLG